MGPVTLVVTSLLMEAGEVAWLSAKLKLFWIPAMAITASSFGKRERSLEIWEGRAAMSEASIWEGRLAGVPLCGNDGKGTGMEAGGLRVRRNRVWGHGLPVGSRGLLIPSAMPASALDDALQR